MKRENIFKKIHKEELMRLKSSLAATLAFTALAASVYANNGPADGQDRLRATGRGWAQYAQEQQEGGSESLQNLRFGLDKIPEWSSLNENSVQKVIADQGYPHGITDQTKWAYKNSLKNVIVKHGDFLNKPLYWKAKWAVELTDKPGTIAPEGGTSGWKLLNTNDPLNDGEWVGGEMTPGSSAKVQLPTWQDGAKGAYTIISDDIGAFDSPEGYEEVVQIAEEYNGPARDYFDGFNPIRCGFGAQVDKSDEVEYKWMQDAVVQGHEIINHSYNHSSAAEQWQWFYECDADDEAVAKEIDGFTKSGGDTIPVSGMCEGFDDEYVAHLAYIGELESQKLHVGKDLPKWASGAIVLPPKKFDAAPGTVTEYGSYTLSGGATGKYKVKDAADARYICTNDSSWIDATQAAILKLASFERAGLDEFEDKYNGWQNSEWNLNIAKSRDTLNMKVYDVLRSEKRLPARYWPENKGVDYYIYPYDAFSNETHDSLEANGYVAARGGSKGSSCTPNDFFHPFRLDFDAHYSDAMGQYPDNPHQYLTLKAMLDTIVAQKGYHIREIHTVTDRDDLGWGYVPMQKWRDHISDVLDLIKSNDITMYTPTNVVKYRITSDNMSIAIEESGSNEWTITPTITLEEKFHDIYKDVLISYRMTVPTGVTIPEGKSLVAKYVDSGELVRRQPWLRPGSKTWSVYGDPYKGAVKVYIDEKVAITPSITVSDKKASFLGIKNGKMSLMLPKGKCNIEVYTMSGRMMSSVSQISNGRIANIALPALSSGVYILNVKQEGKLTLRQRFIAK